MSDPGRSLVLAQVTGIRDNNLVYPSCYQCYSKVYIRQDAEQNLWQCLKCKAVHTEADIYERYRLHLSITDDSTICDVTVFGTNVDELFGCSASHFKKSVNVKCDGTEGLLASALEEVFVGRFFLFGFKSSPIRRRDSEKCFRTPVTLAGVIASNNRGHVNNATSQQSSPALVAYQMIPMQESVNKSDFPTVVQVLKRKILTRNSTNSQKIPDITREESPHSDSTLGSTSRYSLCDQTSGNLTMSYMQSSSRSSINMTYGQPSVLLSCDRDNSRVQLTHPNEPEAGDVLGQQGLSNQSKVSQRSQQFNSNVEYRQRHNLGHKMASIGSSFIKHCSLQDSQTTDLDEIKFDQSIALVSPQSGLTHEGGAINEVPVDCHKDIIPRPTQTSDNDQVDNRLVDTCHEENRDVHFGDDDFNVTFDPNEADPQDSDSRALVRPHSALVTGSQSAVLPTDQGPPTTSSATFCDKLMQTMSDSCDSDSDSLLLLALTNGAGVGDQNLDRPTGKIPTRTLAPDRVSDEDKNTNVCEGSKGVSNGLLTSSSNMDHAVADSTNGDFPEEDLPFSEDLDAFLQDMSYSQAECSQEQLPNKRTVATAGVPVKENVLHTSNIGEDSENCVLAKEKGSTQSRVLCDEAVQNAAGPSTNQNAIETSNADNHKATLSKQEVDPLENGSGDLFFTKDMPKQDSKLDRSTGKIPTRTLAPDRVSGENKNTKECEGSKGVSNGSLTSSSPGSRDTVVDMTQSQGQANMDQVVANSQSGDVAFPEEDLPFSEDLDAFLQDMSYSQAECSQEQLLDKRTVATAGVPLKENVLHTSNIREDSENCLLAKEKGSTQSRVLCDEAIQNVAGPYTNQNNIATSDTCNQKVSPSKQEVDPLENGSEDLFFTQDMSQQDSKLDMNSGNSPSGSYGSTANSQSMNLFSGSELFSESYIDVEQDTTKGSCTEESKVEVKSANQTGPTIDTPLTSVWNVLKGDERSKKKFTSGVLGQGTKIHRDLYRTPLTEKLNSRVKNVQFAGLLTEAKDIAHIDLRMKTKPTPVAKTRRKSCLKSGVSFVPSSVSPLQVLQVSSPGIISTQMDLFSPSPEVVVRQQTTHRRNSTFHSTPVRTNNASNRVSQKTGIYSICNSSDDSFDIIPSSAVRPSRIQLLRLSSKSEATKSKHCPADKENVVTNIGFEGIHRVSYSSNVTTNLCDRKSPTRELNQTVDSLQSQEMSQDLFSSAQSGDLFSDCSWEEDLDICKKLF